MRSDVHRRLPHPLGFDFIDEIPPAAQGTDHEGCRAASRETWKHDQHSGKRRKFVGIRKLISIRNRPSARELAIIICAVQYDAIAVTGNLGFEEILIEPLPGDDVVSPATMPAVFLVN